MHPTDKTPKPYLNTFRPFAALRAISVGYFEKWVMSTGYSPREPENRCAAQRAIFETGQIFLAHWAKSHSRGVKAPKIATGLRLSSRGLFLMG